ncbi:MAG: DHH family phosphoesterase [Clostridia bacterium]|nr:DHH family phosphoesterase [Clostridia bacterium]
MNKVVAPDGDDGGVFSLPAVVCNKEGTIIWFNQLFQQEVIDDYDIKKLSMSDFFEDFSFEKLSEERVSDAVFSDKKFTAFSTLVDGSSLLGIYFFEDTHLKDIAFKYEISRPFVMHIFVDNIESLSRALTDSKFALFLSGIESRIEKWLKDENVILKKVGNGKFLVIGEKHNLDHLSENKFSVLNDVRDYSFEDIPVNATLSIGVGMGHNFTECEHNARRSLDMSLGRGGDQAAIFTEDGYIYFGGVSNRANDNSRVSPRQTAANISNLIKKFDKVIIMGHKYSDFDSVGAAMGMQFFAQANGATGYVVADGRTTLSACLVELAHSSGYNSFISPSKALDICGDDTLVIVVDTHRSALLDSSDLYALAGATVVIDHHRRADDYLDDAQIFYSLPSSSSACEMVTELIEYSTIKDELPDIVATALLSGIVLDTKDYVLRTSKRTFEAAGFLRNNNADTIAVKKLFSIDSDMVTLRNNIIADAELHDGFIIGLTGSENKNLRIVTSSAADEMLNIEGVKASFVISKMGVGKFQISARSLGEENVQLIMESLGGGGHSTMAAAQIKSTGVEQAKKKLINAIDNYISNK